MNTHNGPAEQYEQAALFDLMPDLQSAADDNTHYSRWPVTDRAWPQIEDSAHVSEAWSDLGGNKSEPTPQQAAALQAAGLGGNDTRRLAARAAAYGDIQTSHGLTGILNLTPEEAETRIKGLQRARDYNKSHSTDDWEI